MFDSVTEPQKGDRITAAWGASVARGVNALAPFAVAHGLVRQGATGNGSEPLPENRRNRAGFRYGGLFEIAKVEIEESATVSEDENDDTITGTVSFSNRYFRLGGKTYEATAEECEVSSGQFVALKVGVSESDLLTDYLVAYDDLEALQEAEADMDYYIVPLYKFDDGLAVECDFRIGPFMSAGEVS